MAPLLVLLLWLTASLYPPAQQALIDQISSVAGSSAATVAETVLKNADNQPDVGSLAGVWSTLLLFVGATAVFAQLQNALNLIFRTSGERLEGLKAWLRKRVFSFGVVLALGFLLILSMTATTVLQVAFAQLPSILPALGYVTSLLLYAVGFAFMYHYLPDRRVAWRQAFIGGVITSALFALGRYGIGVYIATVAPGSAYGSMGALVISLVWIYYATVVFFVGALMTAVIDERLRARHHLAAAGIDPATASQVPDRGKLGRPPPVPSRGPAPRPALLPMARIPDAFIDDLLARTDIVEVVGSRVPLKRQGKEYAARCPFHDERSASFTVSPTKQFYHCFGCGAHGTAISFLMNYDRLEFLDAVDELAKRAGMEVPRNENPRSPSSRTTAASCIRHWMPPPGSSRRTWKAATRHAVTLMGVAWTKRTARASRSATPRMATAGCAMRWARTSGA